jgi:hypothetical protein
MEFRSRGSMFLRWKSQNYKVLCVRNPARDCYRFECINLETDKKETFKFRLGGFLEAANQAFKTMTKPQDVFFLDMDHNAQARILTEEQINKLQKLIVLSKRAKYST